MQQNCGLIEISDDLRQMLWDLLWGFTEKALKVSAPWDRCATMTSNLGAGSRWGLLTIPSEGAQWLLLWLLCWLQIQHLDFCLDVDDFASWLRTRRTARTLPRHHALMFGAASFVWNFNRAADSLILSRRRHWSSTGWDASLLWSQSNINPCWKYDVWIAIQGWWAQEQKDFCCDGMQTFTYRWVYSNGCNDHLQFNWVVASQPSFYRFNQHLGWANPHVWWLNAACCASKIETRVWWLWMAINPTWWWSLLMMAMYGYKSQLVEMFGL